MATAVSVAFKRAGKTYDFDSDGLEVGVGDLVVVKTTRGMEVGQIVAAHEAEAGAGLKKIVRKANDDDLASIEKNRQREQEARKIAQRMIASLGLEAKLVDVEYVFDSSKALFYFTAEDRIDFRDLVKDLSAELKTRIEMRQIGVRDEAKIIGGLGPCGQRLCCSVFAGDFEPVSIRMAKEQDLPLNPQKISGVCGRLMCCLKYEYETYKEFKGRAPKKGSLIDTPRGCGKVVDFQVPRERVVVRFEDGCSCAMTLEEFADGGKVAGEAPGRATAERPPAQKSSGGRESSPAEKGAGGRRSAGRPRGGRGGAAPEAAEAQAGPAPETSGEAAGGAAGDVKRRRRRRRKRPSSSGDAPGS